MLHMTFTDMQKKAFLWAVLGLFVFMMCTGRAYAFDLDQDQYLFSANSVAYDDDYAVIVAVGDVEIIGQEEVLRADTITFYEQENRIDAEGNVSITDKEGNVFYTDKISFADEGNNVFTDGILAMLTDKSRITGVSGRRIEGKRTVVKQATYSPCEVCKSDPTTPLPWQINARKVVHDEEAELVKYYNATMDVYGVPVMWVPYFSHPDPTVHQKSGFLRPEYGYKSNLGWLAGGSYYWAMDAYQDMTARLRWTGDQGPVGDLEYRRRFERGDFSIRGSVTESDRVKTDLEHEYTQEDRLRGHIESNLNYHIDNNWRTGFDIFKASDDQYARLYDYSSEKVFENRVFLEGFHDRNFTSAEMFYFQDVRLGDRRDQPSVLPYLRHNGYGEPGGVLGGRWHLDTSFLGLDRDDGQDVSRLSLLTDWQRQFISEYGLSTDILISNNADLYHTRDRLVAQTDPTRDDTSFAARLYPQFHMVNKYPLVKYMQDSQFLLEPTVSFSAGTRLDENDSAIPNEDSKDLLLGWSNLFSPNRFPGGDRLEDGLRTTYGLRGSVFKNNGSYGSVFLGQSYRITDDNIYPNNIGLEEDGSDFVGGLQLGLLDRLILDYNVQMDDEEYSLRRHEVRSTLNMDEFRAQVSYFYDKSVNGTNLDTVREQIRPAFEWDFYDQWRFGGSALYDFSPEQDGLVRAQGVLTYYNDCLDVNMGIKRNLVDRATGEGEFEFLVSLGFKNLGDFKGPSVTLSDEESYND